MAINTPEHIVPEEHSLPEDEQLVSCDICLRTIPLSEADISEAEEYVAYFCGLECYDIWRNRQDDPAA